MGMPLTQQICLLAAQPAAVRWKRKFSRTGLPMVKDTEKPLSGRECQVSPSCYESPKHNSQNAEDDVQGILFPVVKKEERGWGEKS